MFPSKPSFNKIKRKDSGYLLQWDLGSSKMLSNNIFKLLFEDVKASSPGIMIINNNGGDILWVNNEFIFEKSYKKEYQAWLVSAFEMVGVVLETETECDKFVDYANKLIMWEMLKY